MDNHPIPQNVTSFQFKLLGEMTIKQFGYVAGGVILAWIFFTLPVFFLIKFPLSFLFFSLGISLAFFPFEGRPLDLMFSAYIKALFTPNQYVFQKSYQDFALLSPLPIAASPQASAQPKTGVNIQDYLKQIQRPPQDIFDEKETAFFDTIAANFSSPLQKVPFYASATSPLADKPQYASQSSIVQPSQPKSHPMTIASSLPQTPRIPTIKQQGPIDQAGKDAQKLIDKELEELHTHTKKTHGESQLEKELERLKQELEQTKMQQQGHQEIYQKALAFEKQLTEVLAEKKQLEEQLLKLNQQMTMRQRVFTPSMGQTQQETKNVRKISKSLGAKTGAPLTPDVSNLISGVIKDSRGNILPNILIEIKDKSANPVRAFKTNSLGQFASATPLASGSYTIEFEDPQGNHKFDAVSLTLADEIIQPLEIISTDAREELRKDLFGV